MVQQQQQQQEEEDGDAEISTRSELQNGNKTGGGSSKDENSAADPSSLSNNDDPSSSSKVVFVYSEATKNMKIPKDVTHVQIDPSVTEIHDGAFSFRSDLIQVTFCSCSKSKLRRIGSKAFFFCKKLTQLDPFPNTLEEIGSFCFGQCKGLKFIQFPKHVSQIGQFAFAQCEGLQRIEMESNNDTKNKKTIEIQWGAFFRCYQLRSVHFVSVGLEWIELLTIGALAFYKCVSLVHVRVPSTVVAMDRSAFSNCSNLISLEVPEHITTYLNHNKVNDEQQHSLNQEQHLQQQRGVDPSELVFFQCTSLVNLAMPKPQPSSTLTPQLRPPTTTSATLSTTMQLVATGDDNNNEGFLEQLEFQHVATNINILVTKLQHRFDSCPIHKLCYYQSYYFHNDIEQQWNEEIQKDVSYQQVDAFGMTPFHILALSQTPNIVLFKAIWKHYTTTMQEHAPPDLIGRKDAFGKTPLDYLAFKRYDSTKNEEAATEMIRIIITQRLEFLGLNQWKMNIQTIMNQALCPTTPTTTTEPEITELEMRRSRIQRMRAGRQSTSTSTSNRNDEIVRVQTRPIGLLRYKLAIYERKEILSLIELALWDQQLNDTAKEEEEESMTANKEENNKSNVSVQHSKRSFRYNCRINCGVETVISRVLPFLPPITLEDYTVRTLSQQQQQ
eukprot:scaffold22615_cov97-Cylindrotheca_fusiformis.AAC.6